VKVKEVFPAFLPWLVDWESELTLQGLEKQIQNVRKLDGRIVADINYVAEFIVHGKKESTFFIGFPDETVLVGQEVELYDG